MSYSERRLRVLSKLRKEQPSGLEHEGVVHRGSGTEEVEEKKKGDVPGEQEPLRRGRARDARGTRDEAQTRIGACQG